jgi:Mn2+/Fe2+ NRAMP family transporter
LAVDAAYLLFTIGLVGTGMLGVPVLAGSGAYAISEAMHWKGSLDDSPRAAPKFYGVLAAGVIIGLVLDYFGFNAIRMLFIAAVVNGVMAAPLIVVIVLLTSDSRVMGKRVNPALLRGLGWITAAVMAAASLGMLVS